MRKFMILLLTAVFVFSVSAPAYAALPSKYTTPSWVNSSTTRLPSTVTRIEAEAYCGNTSITGLLIPADTEFIGSSAFAGCTNLSRIVVYSKTVKLERNALGSADEYKEIWAPAGSTAEAYANAYGYKFVRMPVDATDLLEYAASLLGTTYGHYTYTKNADGTYKYSKLDCVFFVYVCYRDVFGITLAQSCSEEQYLSSRSFFIKQGLTATKITSVYDLMPGDIICWKSDTSSGCTHVGLYIGGVTINGKTYPKGAFIDASSSAGKVQIGNFDVNKISSSYTPWYVRNFMHAWRIL